MSSSTSLGFRALLVAVVVLFVGSGTWLGYQKFVRVSCNEPLRISVAAAPEIASAIRQAAGEWAKNEPKVNGRCVVVDVSSADSADVAAAIAAQRGATVSGVGQASGKIRVPDVWVPDSSTWLQRLRTTGKTDVVPIDAPSVARSPVVVAMPEPVARSLGWPAKKLAWTDLLQVITTSTTLHTGIVEPNRDAAALSGLLALGAAANAAGPAGQQAAISALRSLAIGRSLLRSDLLVGFPRAADPATISASLTAAPLSEQAVIDYNNDQPPVRLAPLYLEPVPMPLDYPYAVLPGLAGDRLRAAGGLRAVLAGTAYNDLLAASGLRAADGTSGAGFPTLPGAPTGSTPAVPPPNPAVVGKALATWTAVTLPARMLAVIDVSGSMLRPVPTAGGRTREEVTIDAAKRGLGLFDDSWVVGIWTFSTELEGANDYKELVPIGPLAAQRTQILSALGTVKPKQNGDTGLYDSLLAAYKTVLSGWDPGRVNSVVFLTDGVNDDKNGLNLAQLLAALQKIVDPTKPVQVVMIGIGNEVNRDELQRITGTTGGGVFVTEDPAKIGEIFLQAIALRPSR